MKTTRFPSVTRPLLRAVLFAVFLALFFRAGEFLSGGLSDLEDRIRLSGGERVVSIICIGDSITKTGTDYSYARQLETELNRSLGCPCVRVVNKAVPQKDSAYFVKMLPGWIREYRPVAVLSMIGMNESAGRQPVNDRRVGISFLRRLLTEGPLGRAFQKTAREVDDGASGRDVPGIPGVNPVDEERFRSVKALPERYQRLYADGIYAWNMEPRRAVGIFKELIDYAKSQKQQYLVDIFYWKYLSALLKIEDEAGFCEALKDLLEINPFNGWVTTYVPVLCREPQMGRNIKGILAGIIEKRPETIPYYDLLGACCVNLGEKEEADRAFKRAGALRRKFYNPAFKANYNRIVDITDERHVNLVVIQYPMRDIETLKAILPVDDPRVTFFDTTAVFRPLMERLGYDGLFIDRTGGDFGHLTPEAHEILAEHLAPVILRKVLNRRETALP